MGELIIYQSDDGKARVQFRANDGSLWLTQLQLAELYGVTVAMIGDRQKSDHKRKLAEDGFLVTSHRCFQRLRKIRERLLQRSGQGVTTLGMASA